jgi:hypothetical protein
VPGGSFPSSSDAASSKKPAWSSAALEMIDVAERASTGKPIDAVVSELSVEPVDDTGAVGSVGAKADCVTISVDLGFKLRG